MGSDSAILLTANRSRRVLAAGGVWLFTYLVARYAIGRLGPAHGWAPLVACAPIPAFYWFVWVVERALKGTDELGRRIHLEAVALAFAATMLVLMTLGLLDMTLPLRNAWAWLPLLYGVSVAIVSRRYR
jgi:hypothetical protein